MIQVWTKVTGVTPAILGLVGISKTDGCLPIIV